MNWVSHLVETELGATFGCDRPSGTANNLNHQFFHFVDGFFENFAQLPLIFFWTTWNTTMNL